MRNFATVPYVPGMLSPELLLLGGKLGLVSLIVRLCPTRLVPPLHFVLLTCAVLSARLTRSIRQIRLADLTCIVCALVPQGVFVAKPIVALIPKYWFNQMQYWLTGYAAYKLLSAGIGGMLAAGQ